MVVLALSPILRMKSRQLLDTILDLVNGISSYLGRKSAPLVNKIVHDGDTLLLARSAPPAFGKDHVVNGGCNLGEELCFALRQTDCPWLSLNHLGVEYALDTDVGRFIFAALIFIGDGVEELAGCTPDVARVLDGLDFVAEFGTEPIGRQLIWESWKSFACIRHACGLGNLAACLKYSHAIPWSRLSLYS